MTYDSKASPDLFNESLDITNEINQLKHIIQNDMKISEEQLVEFEEDVKDKVKRLWVWKKKVIEHIKQAPVV